MTSRIGNDPGFTFIEVMIAVAILAVGIIGVLGTYVKLVDALGVGQDYLDAFYLLKEKMTEIERSALEDSGVSLGFSKGGFRDDYESFNWELEVRPSLASGLNEVTLTVSRRGRPRTYFLRTYQEDKK